MPRESLTFFSSSLEPPLESSSSFSARRSVDAGTLLEQKEKQWKRLDSRARETDLEFFREDFGGRVDGLLT